MVVAPQYRTDVEAIVGTRWQQGADFWATEQGGLARGGPFSTLEAPALLVELGLDPSHEVLRGAADLLLGAWREDGRFKVSPSGAIYPCHTVNAVRVLTLLGHASDERVRRSFEHLLGTVHDDGGWRCRKFSYGRGPETEASNPGPTLAALDALRLAGLAASAPEGAVDLLLGHWESRLPLGPCHFGIGTLFLQVGYPFGGYNLFGYVHVLSSYERARRDPRFHEALAALQSRLVDGHVVVERVHRSLAQLEFCRKGRPSELATARYAEILARLDPA